MQRKNQTERIVDLLMSARGSWVEAPRLAEISLQYGTVGFAISLADRVLHVIEKIAA